MNQLTTTNNNKHFTLETSIMEKIFDASGYNFHVLTIDGHKYWIGRELAHAFDYSTPTNMLKTMKKEDVHKKVIVKKQPKNANKNWHKNRMEGLYDLAPLLMDSAGRLLKEGAESHWGKINFDKLNTLILVREDTLQEFLTIHTRKPDAKEVGKKLYEYFTQPKTLVEVFEEESNPLKDLIYTEAERLELSKEYLSWYWALEQGQPELYEGLVKEEHPLYQRIHTETEAEGFGSEFASWYFERVVKSRYLRSWNRRERKYNWLMNQSLGFYVSLNWEEKQFKFIFQEKEDAGNLLHFASLYRPANFKAIMTPC